MSLTNPNNVVTEERLNEYHQTILPYLGGMPDVLANKFSRADLYSTDEKMVGRWIDGKPIYQKSYTGTTTNNQTRAWNTVESGFGTTKKLVGIASGSCIKDGENGAVYPLTNQTGVNGSTMGVGVISNGTDLAIVTEGLQPAPYVLTVLYTKTTDSPIDIGLDTDYSTDEKIIGTWIDGSPVYQKTIDCGNLPNNSTKSVVIGNEAINKVIDMYGMVYNNSEVYSLPFSHPTNTYNVGLKAEDLSTNAPKVKIITGYDYSAYNAYVTVQYTKTS